MMKNKLLNDKRGIAPLIPIIIAALVFILGISTTVKITSIINSIPTIVWYGIAFLIILMLLPKKK